MNNPQDVEQPEYSKEEARAISQRSLREGSFLSPKYARKRMRERDITNNDLLCLARTGIVVKAPELDIKTGEWTYRIENEATKLKAVFAIPKPEQVRLITVIAD